MRFFILVLHSDGVKPCTLAPQALQLSSRTGPEFAPLGEEELGVATPPGIGGILLVIEQGLIGHVERSEQGGRVADDELRVDISVVAEVRSLGSGSEVFGERIFSEKAPKTA